MRHLAAATLILTTVLFATPARAAQGTITARPNPCIILPGKHACTTHIIWSTDAPHARVYVRAEGKKALPEREFGSGKSCVKCTAPWIEAGTRYVFTLVDVTPGRRRPVLATVTVTGVK